MIIIDLQNIPVANNELDMKQDSQMHKINLTRDNKTGGINRSAEDL